MEVHSSMAITVRMSEQRMTHGGQLDLHRGHIQVDRYGDSNNNIATDGGRIGNQQRVT